MEQVTVSSKGQIAIPKAVRDLMDLSAGAKLMIESGDRKLCSPKNQPGRSCTGPPPAATWLPPSPYTRSGRASMKTRVLGSRGNSGMDQWQKTSRHPRGRAPRGGRRRTSSTPDERYQRGRGLLLPAEAPQPGPRGVS